MPFTVVYDRQLDMYCRDYVRGLDWMAVSGSEDALNILKQDGDTSYERFDSQFKEARKEERTTVIHIHTVPERKMAGYGYAWWDVPVAEVSKSESVQKARESYIEQKKNQRYFF